MAVDGGGSAPWLGTQILIGLTSFLPREQYPRYPVQDVGERGLGERGLGGIRPVPYRPPTRAPTSPPSSPPSLPPSPVNPPSSPPSTPGPRPITPSLPPSSSPSLGQEPRAVSGENRFAIRLAVPKPAPRPPKRAPRRRPKPKPRPPRRPPRIPVPKIPRVPDVPVRFPKIPLPVPGLPGVILRAIQIGLRIYELLPKIQPPTKGPPRREPPKRPPPDTVPVPVEVPPILPLPETVPEIVVTSPRPAVQARSPATDFPRPSVSVPTPTAPAPGTLPASARNLWPLTLLALPLLLPRSSARRKLAPQTAPELALRPRVPGRPPPRLQIAPGRPPVPSLQTGFAASDFQTEAERERCRCKKPRKKKRKTCYQGFYREDKDSIRFERWDEVTCEGGKRGSRTPEQKRADRARRAKIRQARKDRLTSSKAAKLALGQA